MMWLQVTEVSLKWIWYFEPKVVSHNDCVFRFTGNECSQKKNWKCGEEATEMIQK